MKEKEKTYQINNLSEEQIKVISDALEMYTRLGLLQFDKVIDHLFGWHNRTFDNGFNTHRDEITRHCHDIRNLIVSKDEEMAKYEEYGHWSLGIGNDKTSIDAKIAYEIEKDIKIQVNNDKRGRLTLTKETPTVVKEMNLRKEKVNQLISKITEDDSD